MKTSNLSLCALLGVCLAVAACAPTTELSRLQYTPTVNAVRDRGPHPLVVFSLLYSFGKPPDGSSPLARVVDVGGTFYGTTYRGGKNCGASGGCGTVFSISTKGKEKVLHSFGAGTDGAYPYAGLIDISGTLYGTTRLGGKYACKTTSYGRCGTVFSIKTDGTESVLHNFGNGIDGSLPFGDLIDVSGTLYGTTYKGGAHNLGTVFSITTKRKENVLHSFAGDTDGWGPYAGLTDVGGTLYGTTFGGGPYGGGTVFSVTTKGKESVIHGFGNGNDGVQPLAGLTDVGGTLYGTTGFGGAYGYGAVFSVTTKGKEAVLHSLGNGSDGANPGAPLTGVGSTLYGTASAGGANSYGAVFSITTKGQEKVVFSFGGSDGWGPHAGLTYVGGRLYGTTEYGGAYTCVDASCGTVFSVTTGGTEDVLNDALRRNGAWR